MLPQHNLLGPQPYNISPLETSLSLFVESDPSSYVTEVQQLCVEFVQHHLFRYLHKSIILTPRRFKKHNKARAIFQTPSEPFKVSQSQTTHYYTYLTNEMSSRSVSPETMPTHRRSVDFAESPAYSRLPRDDELYVMKGFARHASHCGSCAQPYEIFRRGGTLCSRGHQRALDVAQYLYNRAGQAHSITDREHGQRVHVEIPAKCEAVRGLLKALERGMPLRRKVSASNYANFDNSYYTSSSTYPRERPRAHHRQNSTSSTATSSSTSSLREPRYIRKPSLETTVVPPPNRYRQLRRDNNFYTGRDTLFEHDFRDKERRYRQRPIYFDEDTRYPPPVPPKDERWRYWRR